MTEPLLRIFPDTVLRQKARPVVRFDLSLRALGERLHGFMRSQKHGIGIAAPQIGVSLRVALVDVSSRVPGAFPILLVNPRLVLAEGQKMSREGCMSIPDYTGDLKRYERVRVRWQDLEGSWHEKDCEGIESVCVQHEIDHLDGILFMDRVTCLKTDMMPRHFKRAGKRSK